MDPSEPALPGDGPVFTDPLAGASGASGAARHTDTIGDAVRRGHDRVEANARLTGLTAGVLLILLAIEGFSLLRVGRHLSLHVFVGMMLVPVVVVKIASTGWRFVRYYRRDPAYRAKGPPPLLLRLLGPVVVVLTVILFASGILLLLGPSSVHRPMSLLHKASFILWFGAMTVHVLGHVVETSHLAPADLVRRTRRQVRGADTRLWVVATSLALGAVLGWVTLPAVGHWLGGGPFIPGG